MNRRQSEGTAHQSGNADTTRMPPQALSVPVSARRGSLADSQSRAANDSQGRGSLADSQSRLDNGPPRVKSGSLVPGQQATLGRWTSTAAGDSKSASTDKLRYAAPHADSVRPKTQPSVSTEANSPMSIGSLQNSRSLPHGTQMRQMSQMTEDESRKSSLENPRYAPPHTLASRQRSSMQPAGTEDSSVRIPSLSIDSNRYTAAPRVSPIRQRAQGSQHSAATEDEGSVRIPSFPSQLAAAQNAPRMISTPSLSRSQGTVSPPRQQLGAATPPHAKSDKSGSALTQIGSPRTKEPSRERVPSPLSHDRSRHSRVRSAGYLQPQVGDTADDFLLEKLFASMEEAMTSYNSFDELTSSRAIGSDSDVSKSNSQVNIQSQKVVSELKALLAQERRLLVDSLPAVCGVLRGEAEKELAKVQTVSAKILSTLTEVSLPAACEYLKAEVQKCMDEVKSMTYDKSAPQKADLKEDTERAISVLSEATLQFQQELQQYQEARLASWSEKAHLAMNEMKDLLEEARRVKVEWLDQKAATSELVDLEVASFHDFSTRFGERIAALESEVRLTKSDNGASASDDVSLCRAMIMEERQERIRSVDAETVARADTLATLQDAIRILTEKFESVVSEDAMSLLMTRHVSTLQNEFKRELDQKLEGVANSVLDKASQAQLECVKLGTLLQEERLERRQSAEEALRARTELMATVQDERKQSAEEAVRARTELLATVQDAISKANFKNEQTEEPGAFQAQMMLLESKLKSEFESIATEIENQMRVASKTIFTSALEEQKMAWGRALEDESRARGDMCESLQGAMSDLKEKLQGSMADLKEKLETSMQEQPKAVEAHVKMHTSALGSELRREFASTAQDAAHQARISVEAMILEEKQERKRSLEETVAALQEATKDLNQKFEAAMTEQPKTIAAQIKNHMEAIGSELRQDVEVFEKIANEAASKATASCGSSLRSMLLEEKQERKRAMEEESFARADAIKSMQSTMSDLKKHVEFAKSEQATNGESVMKAHTSALEVKFRSELERVAAIAASKVSLAELHSTCQDVMQDRPQSNSNTASIQALLIEERQERTQAMDDERRARTDMFIELKDDLSELKENFKAEWKVVQTLHEAEINVNRETNLQDMSNMHRALVEIRQQLDAEKDARMSTSTRMEATVDVLARDMRTLRK